MLRPGNVLINDIIDGLVPGYPVGGIDVGLVDRWAQDGGRCAVFGQHFLDGLKIVDLVVGAGGHFLNSGILGQSLQLGEKGLDVEDGGLAFLNKFGFVSLGEVGALVLEHQNWDQCS